MKSLLYILLIGISGLISCVGSSDTPYPRYMAFPLERTIAAQEVSLDTVFLRYPFRVTVQDSIAIVMDLHNVDYYFHAFRYPEWKPIASFGKRGEAPGEMLSAETFQFNSLDSIWALDANKMQITRWSLSPANGLAERQEVIPLDKSLIRVLDFYATDSFFLIPDYLGEHRYWQVSYNGKPINSIGKIPTEINLAAGIRPALAQAWRSFIDYNPQNGVFAMVTQLGEAIEIYNLKENTHTILYGPNGEPEFKASGGESMPTGIMGFSDIQVTDKYIYAVFHGVTFKDKIAAYKRGEELEDGGRFIYVFDLQGKPVQKYTLDKPIYGIDVNEDTNTIIATCVESDNPIVEFKI